MIALIALALAVTPLADPDQEARARALEAEIRCVACENEPISQSGAEIAQDMRRELRARIEAGDTDSEIRASFRQRYGDFVLLRPPIDARTWALWGAPLVLAALAFAALLGLRRKRETGGPNLEAEESER